MPWPDIRGPLNLSFIIDWLRRPLLPIFNFERGRRGRATLALRHKCPVRCFDEAWQ